MRTTEHFLHFADLELNRLQQVLARGHELKKSWRAGTMTSSLTGKTMALLFSMPSTRTRLSFEAGVAQLGGAVLYIDASTTQLARNEPIADTARVFGSMCDAVVIRHHDHEQMLEFAKYCGASVINALSQLEHPCQVLADVMTFEEARGPIAGQQVAWIGDCNNVCNSWIEASKLLDFKLTIAAPAGYDKPAVKIPASVTLVASPQEAVAGAACVVTDVWASMGDDVAERQTAFANYRVEQALMDQAADAIFMHCLPAHRGEEVSADVIDGPASVVWEEAENRMHVQKALLESLLGATP